MIDRPLPPTDPPTPAEDADRPAGRGETAWLYLLGGLTADEAVAFEAALADDPALQGDLADAVAWTAMLRQAGEGATGPALVPAGASVPAEGSATGARRVAWRRIATGGGILAAGLALGVIVTGADRMTGWLGGPADGGVGVAAAGHSDEQVALARMWWTVSRDGWHDDPAGATGPSAADSAPAGPGEVHVGGPSALPPAPVRHEAGGPDAEAGGEMQAVVPPAWLVAALAVGPGGGVPVEPFDEGAAGDSSDAPTSPGGPL